MKYIFVFVLFAAGLAGKPVQAQNSQLCDLYGTVYIEKEKTLADFSIYIEETSESFADLVIFREDNQLFADKSGIWYFTDNRGLAQYRVFIEKNKDRADFSIFYTDTRSFAGCR
jgi:hypothetical protein